MSVLYPARLTPVVTLMSGVFKNGTIRSAYKGRGINIG